MANNVLVVGGTSGLGLELAKTYATLGHTVFITGRKDPKLTNLQFRSFPISASVSRLVVRANQLVASLPPINTFVYAAGYYQEGLIDTLSDDDILEMINVGLTAPALLIGRLKKNLGTPLKVVLITSTSQSTPRELEPMYTAVKSGLGMLGNSLGLDPGLGQVLVAAPAGMKTPFWEEEHDISDYLEPEWVAKQISRLSNGRFKYKYAKILRVPARVEVVETRN